MKGSILLEKVNDSTLYTLGIILSDYIQTKLEDGLEWYTLDVYWFEYQNVEGISLLYSDPDMYILHDNKLFLLDLPNLNPTAAWLTEKRFNEPIRIKDYVKCIA